MERRGGGARGERGGSARARSLASTKGERERPTDGQTNRKADRERVRQIDRQTYIQRGEGDLGRNEGSHITENWNSSIQLQQIALSKVS